MNKKLYWGLGVLIILLIGAMVFLLVKDRADRAEIRQLEKELEALQKRKEDQNASEVSKEEHPPHLHFHEDGTFHEGEHADEPKVKYTAPPGAVLKPDFPPIDPKDDPVKAAYKRLEYIKNNPYAWGGVHSERATELIDLLMTASGPIRVIDHEHGDQVIEQIEELCEQGDPRAAGVLIAHMCDGDTVGRVMIDTLVEIGPPAVLYILPYLEKFVAQGGTTSIGMFDALGRIGIRYRDDLDGIVQHIIIPKLKVIDADEDNKRYDSGSVIDARAALELLE